MEATTVRIMSTLSLNVIHMICNRLLLFLSGRRLMPNTRFLSIYGSELVWRIGADAVGHGAEPRDSTPFSAKVELAALVTLLKSTVPSNVVSSILNPLELSVRKPCSRPRNPPNAQKALRLFGLNILESCPGEKAYGLSST
jgi:hypothetical protein